MEFDGSCVAHRDARVRTKLTRVRSEREKLLRLSELNRQMMRLPMEERRRLWKEYFARVDELMNPSPKATE